MLFRSSRSPTKDMKTRCRNSTIYTESWQKKAAAPELDLCFQDVLSIDSCPSVHVQEGIRSLDVGVTNTFQHVGIESRVSSTVSPFRVEQGTSLETPSRARASSSQAVGTTWFFSSCGGILELRRGLKIGKQDFCNLTRLKLK